MERQPSSIADVCWPPTWGEERVSLPALPEFVELLRAPAAARSCACSSAPRGASPHATSSSASCADSCGSPTAPRRRRRFLAALDPLIEVDADGGVGLVGQRPLPIGVVTWRPR